MKASLRVLMAALVVFGLSAAVQAQTLNRYWADLQGDNDQGGTPAQFYSFARDSVALDVVALTAHGSALTDTRWTNIKNAAAATYMPGSFVAFSGYEWNHDTWGHRACYFLTDDQPLYKPNVVASDTPDEFYALFGTTNGLSHGAHPTLSSFTMNWNYFNGDLQPNAEIYSRWGTYETATSGKGVRDVWARGYRVGVIGTSDTHTWPGVGGGLTAIMAPALTREAILDALRARHTYATNGARIALDFNIGSYTTGDFINDVSGDPTIHAHVEGTAPLTRLELRRSNTLIYTYAPPPQRVFVEIGAPLTYFKGTVDPPANWTSPSFNDAGWLAGRSGIGFGNEDDVTAITGMVNKYLALYTRQTFTVTDNAPQYLFLGCDYDDGFIAYIDGVEVLRANMPAGPVTAATAAGPFRNPNMAAKAVIGATVAPFYTDTGLAGGTPKDPALDMFDLNAYAAMLTPGAHTLAIEIHNSLLSSNDLTLIPRLIEIDPTTTATIAYTDAGATGDRWYDVKAIQMDGGICWSSPIWLNPDAPPRPVATLVDIAGDNGTALQLTWTKSVAPDFGRYNIYVSESSFADAGGMTPWNETPITNADSLSALISSFNGAPLTRGRLYYVYVGAFDQAGKMNGITSGCLASAAPVDNIPPAAPTSISVIDTPGDDGGNLRISWSLSPDDGAGMRDVATYEIFRRKSSTSTYSSTPLATRPAGTTLFSDNTAVDGTNYYYKIRANDGFNISGYTVEFGPITSINNGGLPEPKNVAAADRAADQGGWIRVTWTAIPNDTLLITRYNVYRTTTPGIYGSPKGWVPRATAIFNDSTAAADIDYYYVVEADSAGVKKSTLSAEVGPVRALDNVAPAAVTLLTATNTLAGGTVSLDWTGYDEALQGDVAGYNVYYKTSSFTTIGTLTPVFTAPIHATTATVTGLTNNTTYYFAVAPIDEAGNYTNAVISRSAKPTDTTAPTFAGLQSATPGDGSITLAWNPARDNSLPITYQLYQSLTSGGYNYNTPLVTFTGSTPMVPMGAAWRFLKGTSSPPALWKDRNFDDSGWLQGEGAFGYDTGSRYQVATTLSDMNGVYTSVYFRTNFTLNSLPQALLLGVLVDDGYIAYLNGTEVSRDNLNSPANYNSLAESGVNPSWSGVLDFNSPTNYNPNPTLRWIDISAYASLLVQGRNTLAFQVHNYKKTNADFVFLAQLDQAIVRYDVSGLSPSQTYNYVMRCSDGLNNKNLNSTEVSARPLQLPPPAPVAGLSAVKSGSSVLLRWSPVVTDSAGTPITTHHYNVYRGTDPNFLPDTAAHTNLIGSSTSATYTDAGALGTTTSTFYRVLAVSNSGRESYAPSALAQKAQLALNWTPAQENAFWISMPYLSGIPDAQSLVNDLNRGPVPGPVRKITRLNPATQVLQSLAYDASGAWMGDNFPVIAGEAYSITLQSNLSQSLVGAHNPTLGLNLVFKTDKSNIYWLSLPYNAAYTDAQALLEHLNGGPLPTAVAKIVRYDNATGAPQGYIYFAGQWLGTGFPIAPGQGYGIVLRGDVNGWRPRVVR